MALETENAILRGLIPLKSSRFNIDLQWFGGTAAPVFSGSNIDNATRSLGNSEDTPVTGWDKADPFIVALAWEATAGKGTPNNTYQLQWRNLTDSGAWTTLAATGALNWTGATDLVNNNALTSGEAICTGSGTFVDGIEREGANDYTVQLALATWTETQWSIDSSGAIDGKEYEFRLWDSSNAVVVGTGLATITMTAGSVTHALAGTIKSISHVSGVLNLSQTLDGSAKSISHVSGVLNLNQSLSGSSKSISHLSGDLTVHKKLAGSVKSVSHVSGALSLGQQLIGSIKSISHLSGDLTVSGTIDNDKLSLISYNMPFMAAVPVSDDGLGQGDKQHLIWQYSGILWTGVTTHQLAGNIKSVSHASGALSLGQSLTGSIKSVSHLSGALDIHKKLTGSIKSVSHVSGDLSLSQTLDGSVKSISHVSGALNLSQTLNGSVKSVSHLSGDLTVSGGGVTHQLAGSIKSISGVSGAINLNHSLAGDIKSVSKVSGAIKLKHGLSGIVKSISHLISTLKLNHALSGNIKSVSKVSGTLTVNRFLSGSIKSISHLSGNLTVGGEVITETLYFRIDTVESINYDIDNLESLDFRMNTVESLNYNIDIE